MARKQQLQRLGALQKRCKQQLPRPGAENPKGPRDGIAEALNGGFGPLQGRPCGQEAAVASAGKSGAVARKQQLQRPGAKNPKGPRDRIAKAWNGGSSTKLLEAAVAAPRSVAVALRGHSDVEQVQDRSRAGFETWNRSSIALGQDLRR